MATNVDIKNALLKKLDIQEAGLYKRAGAMRRKLPMTAEDSVHLIAFQEGININKYLTAEQVQSVRHLHTQFVQASGTAPAPTAHSSKWRAPTSSTGDREIRFPNEFKVTNPLLPTEKLNEAKAMAAIYPLLYVVENSMREVIKRVMAKQCGEDWWNTEMTTSKLKNVHDTVAGRMTTEKKNSWHQKRGAHPIDYTDVGDLEAIIVAKHQHFIPDIIGDKDWFIQFMKELKPSRNVVCHMNPLDSHNTADIKLKTQRWENVVVAAKDKIPKA
jgi:hypothetical protein